MTKATTVWCLGDSLTEGYSVSGGGGWGGLVLLPYADGLEEASGGLLRGVATGYSGKRTDFLLRHAVNAFESVKDAEPRILSLLCGTNDLAQFRRTCVWSSGDDDDNGEESQATEADQMHRFNASIVAALVQCIDQCLGLMVKAHVSGDGNDDDDSTGRHLHGVVLMTVPPLGASLLKHTEVWRQAAALRADINAQIREAAARYTRARVVVLDAAAVLGTTAIDGVDESFDGLCIRPEYDCGDGLHMSEAGYKALGRAVAEAAAALLPSS